MSLKLTEAQLRAKIKQQDKTIARQKKIIFRQRGEYRSLDSLYRRLRIKSAQQQLIIDEQFNTIHAPKTVDKVGARIPFKL